MGATHLLFHNQGRGRPIGGVSEFLPTNIAGLQLWFDGSDITRLFQDSAKTTPVTSDGDVIGAVEDKSGNGNDATQAITASKPLYKTAIKNGLSVVRLDGVDDFLSVTLTMNSFSVFCVNVLNTANLYVFGFSVGNRFLRFADNDTQIIFDGVATGISAVMDIKDTNWMINEFFRTLGSNPTHYQNGKNYANAGNAVASFVVNAIGQNGAVESGADIGEILYYDTLLSSTDRQDVEAYLNDKWSIY